MFLSYDNDDALRVHEQRPTHALIETLTGPTPPARIAMPRVQGMIGWTNDTTQPAPGTLHRNPVGSCVLASLGAAKNPYAGPIVITGFRYDEAGEPLDLTEIQHSEIEHLDRAVRAALANQPIPDEVARYLDLHPSWADATRAHAHHVIAN